MKKWNLVLSTDENTWIADGPILFIGGFCKLFSRRHIWGSFSYETIKIYKGNRSERELKLNEINLIYRRMLPDLAFELNRMHGVAHSIRYWEIILGHWLKRYISLLDDRFNRIEKAINSYEIACISVKKIDDYVVATEDSMAFQWASNDDSWNLVVFIEILNFLGVKKFDFVSGELPGKNFQMAPKQEVEIKKKGVRRILVGLHRVVHALFSRHDDALIINSRLSVWDHIKLQLTFQQVPFFYKSADLKNHNIDTEFRRSLKIDSANSSKMEEFARLNASKFLPICFLEGYQEALKLVKALNWPSDPRFIFTSNNFDTDEIFKFYTAEKVEKGSQYFVGQHGGNYGTEVGSRYYNEIKTSDFFLTWGWENFHEKCFPAFIFSVPKIPHNNIKNNLLLIQMPILHRIGIDMPGPGYDEHEGYQNQLFEFVKHLNSIPRSSLTVRLHPEHLLHEWDEVTRWKNFDKDVVLEMEGGAIEMSLSKSKLVAISYDSTILLYCLALNIPVVCFWEEGLEHISLEALPYYQLLKSVGIFHETPKSASLLINDVWQDPDTWWSSEKVQLARTKFCNNFARVEDDPAGAMNKIITSITK